MCRFNYQFVEPVLVPLELRRGYCQIGKIAAFLLCKIPYLTLFSYFRLFGVDVEGYDCGLSVTEWLDKYIKSNGNKLVYYKRNLLARKSGDDSQWGDRMVHDKVRYAIMFCLLKQVFHIVPLQQSFKPGVLNQFLARAKLF